jgi:hypothetical protein
MDETEREVSQLGSPVELPEETHLQFNGDLDDEDVDAFPYDESYDESYDEFPEGEMDRTLDDTSD